MEYIEPYSTILVLNSSYEPLHFTNWKRAVVLCFKEKAKVISKRIIKLVNYVKLPFMNEKETYPSRALIYKRDDHFDAEALYIHMKNCNYRVSRATVYNTLELLVSYDLVKKHQFGKNLAQFEKAYGYKQHDHVICANCAKVVEFCDPRIQQIKTMVGQLLNFEITHHSLNLYGICGACQRQAEYDKSMVNSETPHPSIPASADDAGWGD